MIETTLLFSQKAAVESVFLPSFLVSFSRLLATLWCLLINSHSNLELKRAGSVPKRHLSVLEMIEKAVVSVPTTRGHCRALVITLSA